MPLSTLRSAKPKVPKPNRDGKELKPSETVPAAEPDSAPTAAEVVPTADEAEEVEVLSHAAQRKAKKRKLKEVQSDEDGNLDPVSEPPKSKSQSQDDKPARQNSVWVGNLSFKTTDTQLREFFDGVGEITRVHMPKKQAPGNGRGMRGENRGFAYVDFSTPEAQILAITLSEKNLEGRRLLIKNGKQAHQKFARSLIVIVSPR
ncbi:hypothetical protein FRC09_013834 [Ceratobasidium sp. 395]|nr:hypothetical protein FRC09_013834 [Ceratobasidium sp. 395]